MSFDLAVWNTDKRLSNDEAGLLYRDLCESRTDGVRAHPGIEAFYGELTAKHPEIDTVPDDQIDDLDLCPWSIAHDRSQGHIIMCCVWSRAEYVRKLAHSLARKHGLAVFDPQESRVSYPGGDWDIAPRC
jgi:hypothetical protein